MILVAYQRTMAGAAQRAAQRGRVLGEAPKPLPAPVAPPERRVVFIQARARVTLQPRTPLQHVVDKIARMHGCTFDAIMSSSRQRNHAIARGAAICAVQQIRPSMPLLGLGRLFDRDHTSILHAMYRRGYR